MVKYFILGTALLLAPCAQAQEAASRVLRPSPAVYAAPLAEGECVLVTSGGPRRDMPLFASRAVEAPRKNADFSLIKGPPVPLMTGVSSFASY
jgi:hypothetical protein